MAPAEPFVAQSQAQSTAEPQSSSSRQARVYFPPVEPHHSTSSDAEGPTKPYSIGLGPPPVLRHPSIAQDSPVSGERHGDGRRRVRSAHAATGSAAPGRSLRNSAQASNTLRRRTLTTEGPIKGVRQEKSLKMATGLDPSVNDLEPGVFSDEYDLSHEDPQILEDVQRALKLKVRRDARLQAVRVSGSSYSSSSSPVTKSSAPMAARVAKPSLESELDFSPSVGIDNLHPVPISTNDGVTLDWAGSVSEEDKSDRKWHLSIAKRKAKDKPQIPASKEARDRQQQLFSEKLAFIRASVKPQTLKKATITSDQLRRRYGQLFASLESQSGGANPAQVVQWYTKLDPLVQSSLDQAEPMTWQKHLRSRRRTQGQQRLPWHLSALIIEEFVKGQTRRSTMETIPEDLLIGSPSLRDTSPPHTPPFFPPFEFPSQNHLEASLSRRRSYDGHVSFEPVVEAGRRSIGEDSRRSGDGASRPWKYSLPGVTDSPRSSVYSSMFTGSIHSHNANGASPSSSRVHLRDLASIIRNRGNESDGASSSHHSASEDNSRSDDVAQKAPKRRHYFRPPQLDLVSRTQPESETKDPGDKEIPTEWQDLTKTPGQSSTSGTPGPEELLTARDPRDPFARQDTSSTTVGVTPARVLHLRGLRSSLPSSDRPFMRDEGRRGPLIDEETEHQEYERRAQLLDDAISQNRRNRNLLQRIAAGVKEYEAVQSRMSRALGLLHTPLPAELIDAFSHDPAVVTGHTRYLKGWRAVENIHDHILEQNEVVQAYLQQASAEQPVEYNPQGSVLDGPVKSLCAAMDALESHRTSITQKAADVVDTLARVKKLHAAVKAEYNAASAHTAAVYPELSHIVALEESYKDRYQQLWEFGMDALTFLLDTVTPFWRNYGKVIGVDAQDFLIIPWYRHEFTGEAERYPIKALPRRSFRHWIALILFFSLTLAILILQTRAACTFCSYYRLPFDASPGLWWLSVPVFGIVALIQWMASLVEACIVGAQVGVVMWWIGWWASIFD